MDKKDPVPDSIRSGANFNVYPQFSPIENRVASLKDILYSVYKEIISAQI